jgi:hypothetical protein
MTGDWIEMLRITVVLVACQCVIGLAILVVLTMGVVRRGQLIEAARKSGRPPAPPVEDEEVGVQIIYHGGDMHNVTHSWRPAGHPDVIEALNTPGLKIRKADGTEVLGRQ